MAIHCYYTCLAPTNSQKELKHTINLHPSYFGPQTAEYILNKLHSDVEGTCSGRLGYIIAVLGVSIFSFYHFYLYCFTPCVSLRS